MPTAPMFIEVKNLEQNLGLFVQAPGFKQNIFLSVWRKSTSTLNVRNWDLIMANRTTQVVVIGGGISGKLSYICDLVVSNVWFDAR